MSIIESKPLGNLGYHFVPSEFLEPGKDEYHARDKQFNSKSLFRQLNEEEILVLKGNNNFCSNWSDVWVTDKFLPELIRNSFFYGRVRIDDMEDRYLSYRDLELPVGIYNSRVVSCDIGVNVAIHQVGFMSHYIVGDHCILFCVNEMSTSNSAKFGNGIIKHGEDPLRRIRLELCNENAGRSVYPFEGMLAADAYLWSRNAGNGLLYERFEEMTSNRVSKWRGFYSEIGKGCVIKNSHTLKDVKIGPYAYVKGANKLKNLTINSSKKYFSQIGEGCELVNGIIGYGCRVFYGVKAVRFFLSSHSQLKYGARLINSFLGENSTISCCEVLNSLLFSAHEQHHNNSFLCASLVMGQSNLAAGATLGSNHNSRSADGELLAGRGFWPGLCVSLKHNSRFASYTMLAKGDFMYELDVQLPFSLVSQDPEEDALVIIPAFWFQYNMYALLRNEMKFTSRDKRDDKRIRYEYGALAPDTLNEIIEAMEILEKSVGRSYGQEADKEAMELGRKILLNDDSKITREILLHGVENSRRPVRLLKVKEGYLAYKNMLVYYVGRELKSYLEDHDLSALLALIEQGKGRKRKSFDNVGGMLVPQGEVKTLLKELKEGEIKSWDEMHARYFHWSEQYELYKLKHVVSIIWERFAADIDYQGNFLRDIFKEALRVKRWIVEGIEVSRGKDYSNPFRKMMYKDTQQMHDVLGDISQNAFIKEQKEDFYQWEESLNAILEVLNDE